MINKMYLKVYLVDDERIHRKSPAYSEKTTRQQNAQKIWFEPTDVKKASKPFQSRRWEYMKFISPNFNELKIMAHVAGLPVKMEMNIAEFDSETVLKEAVTLSRGLAAFGCTVIVTLGPLGVLIVRNASCAEPFYKNGMFVPNTGAEVSARFYPVKCEKNLMNVSGAGDCFASGFIAAMLRGKSEPACVASGQAASLLALQSSSAVPKQLDVNISTSATYIEM